MAPCAGTVNTLVVGGGIFGLSAALALAENGHDVELQEKAQLGSGSTAKAAGILSTMTWSDDEYKLIAETRGLIGETISLALIEGVDAARSAWKPYDSILVARGEAGAAALDDMQARLERNTEEPERLGWREAAAEFRGLHFEPGEEVLVAQEDGAIESMDLLEAIRARAESEGVSIRQGAPMLQLPVPGDAYEAVVVAGGAWTKGLLAGAGYALPVQAFRTQAASLAFAGATDLPIVHDAALGFYTRPESDDTMIAGNGTQLRPFDPEEYNEAADPEFQHSIAERVVKRFKAGGQAAIRRGWAGLCVATPDRRPLCGPVPGADGLYVLTGDNGFGLMRGLALGQRLADAVDGTIDAGMDPRRFGDDPSDQFEMREGFNL